jgi:hypothetical protein
MLYLSSFKITKECILVYCPNNLFRICDLQFYPLSDHPRLCNLDYPVCSILMSLLVFSPDGMHQTPYSRIQQLSTLFSHQSFIHLIIRWTWKQLHQLRTAVIQWSESWCHCDFKFESNFHIHCNSPAYTVHYLVPMKLIKIPTPLSTI